MKEVCLRKWRVLAGWALLVSMCSVTVQQKRQLPGGWVQMGFNSSHFIGGDGGVIQDKELYNHSNVPSADSFFLAVFFLFPPKTELTAKR